MEFREWDLGALPKESWDVWGGVGLFHSRECGGVDTAGAGSWYRCGIPVSSIPLWNSWYLESQCGIPGFINPNVEFSESPILPQNSQCHRAHSGIPAPMIPVWNSRSLQSPVVFPVLGSHVMIPLRNSWYHQSRCAIPRVSSSTVEFQCHGSQSRIPSVSNPLWNSVLGSHVVIPL